MREVHNPEARKRMLELDREGQEQRQIDAIKVRSSDYHALRRRLLRECERWDQEGLDDAATRLRELLINWEHTTGM